MKTKTYILTLLTLIIHVVMMSQTQNKQVQTIRKDLMSFKNKPIEKRETLFIATEINATAELEKQAAHLDSIAQEIKVASRNRRAGEKLAMQEEAADLLKHAVMLQIKVLELVSKSMYNSYDINKKKLAVLMQMNRRDIDVLDRAEGYKLDAERIWEMAKEILEEANAEVNNEAKLGAMGNAEEKEIMALTKQTKAIDLLKKAEGDNLLLSLATASVK